MEGHACLKYAKPFPTTAAAAAAAAAAALRETLHETKRPQHVTHVLHVQKGSETAAKFFAHRH